MTPSVSIVVASYNYGRYIAAALDSICAQTYPHWQAIVVDDGSMDDSIKVIQRYLDDSRFTLIQQDHCGQPRTKNRGIAASNGLFVAFLDADDRWRPTKLKRQLECFGQSPKAGVVYSRRILINPDGVPIRIDSRRQPEGNVLAQLFRDNFVCFSSALVRREVIERVGGFDENLQLAIDYEWWLRIAEQYDFAAVDEPLVEYRTGHANLSRRVSERLDTALSIMERFRDRDNGTSGINYRQAFAETFRHRGLVARHEPGAGLEWLAKSLRLQPWNVKTWRAVVASLVPNCMRIGFRRLRGISHDWDAVVR